MFFMIQRTEYLDLGPQYFGGDVHKYILQLLRRKVEGKCSGRFGFTLSVISLNSVSRGRLDVDTGAARFEVTYLALVFRPFKFEVFPAQVSNVNSNGFFAEAGPLRVFVSALCIPNSFKFQHEEGIPVFISQGDVQKIQTGSLVRIKIIGIRQTAAELFVVGTIKDDYLGLIQRQMI